MTDELWQFEFEYETHAILRSCSTYATSTTKFISGSPMGGHEARAPPPSLHSSPAMGEEPLMLLAWGE